MLSLLALLESRFEDVTRVIDRLPALFSPQAVSRALLACARRAGLVRARAFLHAPRWGASRRIGITIRTFADGPYWLAARHERRSAQAPVAGDRH